MNNETKNKSKVNELQGIIKDINNKIEYII